MYTDTIEHITILLFHCNENTWNILQLMMMSILLFKIVYTIRISICNNYTTYIYLRTLIKADSYLKSLQFEH